MPRHTISTMIGKIVKQVARLRGSGSALPGLVVERMDHGYLKRTLEPLREGVILVSGTNGKTTTTKVVTEVLQAVGYKVFTNRTGSNFSRGVISELLPLVNWRGKLDADIAVLELDEAWAVHFVRQVKPRMSLFLNVMRDQLDRFGEIDTAAEMLAKNAAAATDRVVLNRDDPRVRVGHLDDPITLLITRRQRQPVTGLKQGELERDASQAESQDRPIVTPHSGELHLFWPPRGISLALNRFDDHRPRKPEPEPDQKPHLPLLIDARVQGDPLPQSALRKQIGEPGRQPQSRRHSFLWVVLKTQPEYRAIGVIPVALLPFQPGVVSAGIHMRNSLATKQDPESFCHHASSCG